eukprot:3861996-Ditylum_brightwellii.AAC.1
MLVILVAQYVTLNEDENESESLTVPSEIMKHGIQVDLIPWTLGGGGAIFWKTSVSHSNGMKRNCIGKYRSQDYRDKCSSP